MRAYRIFSQDVTVSAAQDLITLIGAAGKVARVRRQSCNQSTNTLPTAQGWSVRSRFLPATVTAGSGGSTPTPAIISGGDAAASFTAHANDTTKSTTSGTAVQKSTGGGHLFNTYERVFATVPEQPDVGPSEAYVFELITVLSGTVTLNSELEAEEIGG